MRRRLGMIAFLVVAVIADLAVVSAIAAATGMSSDVRSFLLTFFGVMLGMYGLRLFAQLWPKPQAGWKA